MATPYKIEVSRTVKDELYTTDKVVEGPSNLDEFVSLEGSTGVFQRALKDWKREQAVLLSSKLKSAVDPDAKTPRKANANRIQVD
jgi:hypothetical protein